MKQVVITLVGKDKTGIVESVAQQVFKYNGSWQGSSMSKMAGQFAGIVAIAVPDAEYAPLCQALQELPNLTVTLCEGENERENSALLVNVKITANDKPGIIQEISAALSKFHANVIKLNTSCESAPNWGSTLFVTNMRLELPEDTEIDDLKQRLESIANDMVVDIEAESMLEVSES